MIRMVPIPDWWKPAAESFLGDARNPAPNRDPSDPSGRRAGAFASLVSEIRFAIGSPVAHGDDSDRGVLLGDPEQCLQSWDGMDTEKPSRQTLVHNRQQEVLQRGSRIHPPVRDGPVDLFTAVELVGSLYRR